MEGLYVYPGHDIQLAWRPGRARSVKLQVLYRTRNPNPGDNGLDFIVTDVTDQALVIISTPPNVNKIVRYNANTKKISLLSDHEDEVEINYLDIEYNPPGSGETIKTNQIAINVHKELLEAFPGNASLNVPVDKRLFHCQLSIFGRFDTLVVDFIEFLPGNWIPTKTPKKIEADITGHGFVDFQIVGTPIHCKLDNDKRGKIMGISVGQNTIEITDQTGAHHVVVNMVNFYGDPLKALDPATIQTPNNILTQLPNPQGASTKKSDTFEYSDDPSERFNLLFLSEGYTDAQKGLFEDTVDSLANDIFSDLLYAPFHILRGRFNIWKAFIPSLEPGWTVQHKDSYYPNNPNNLQGLIQVKNSNLGLTFTPARAVDQYSFYPEYNDAFIGDRRRYPLELDWTKAIRRHIWSFSDGKNMTGQNWYTPLPSSTDSDFTKDYGLVIILVNSTADWWYKVSNEGMNYGPIIILPASVNNVSELKTKTTTYSIIESVFPILLNNNKNDLLDFYALKFFFMRFFAKRFDIGHENNTFGFATGNTRTALYGNNVNNMDSINYDRTNNNPVNFSNAIKWNFLHRIKKSERVLGILAVNTAGQGKINIKMQVANNKVSKKWKKGENIFFREFRTANTSAHLSAENHLATFFYDSDYYLDFSDNRYYHIPQNKLDSSGTQVRDPQLFVFEKFIVHGFDGNDVIILQADISDFSAFVNPLTDIEIEKFLNLKLSNNGSFNNGLLYAPVKNGSIIETLIRKEVQTYIDTPPPGGLFYLNTMSTPHPVLSPGNDVGYPDPTLIKSGKNAPKKPKTGNKFPFSVVGSYVGAYNGEKYSYRPTGACLMRNFDKEKVIYEGTLCFVCQYLIVSYVDPAQLETLEKNYPDFAV